MTFSSPRSLGRRDQQPARLAREAEGRLAPEPERPLVGLQLGRITHRLRHQDRADVRRLGEDLGDGHVLRTVGFGVTQGVPGVVEVLGAGHVEHGVGLDRAIVQRTGDRDDLGHRARLVHVDGGDVGGADRVLAGVVVAPHAGHRQHLTRVAVHDDRRAATRRVLRHGLEQRLLGRVLQGTREREHDVVTGHRLVDHPGTGRDRAALSVDLDRALAGHALEEAVVLLLDAGDARAVDVGATHDAARQLAGGRDALLFVIPTDARQREALDRGGEIVIDLAGDVDEALARVGEVTGERRLGHRRQLQDRGQGGGGRLGVGDVLRVGVDGRRRHRDGELHAVAVEHDAPIGRQRRRPDALLLPPCDQPAGVGRLEQRDAADHDGEHGGHGDEHGEQPAPGAPSAPDRRAGRVVVALDPSFEAACRRTRTAGIDLAATRRSRRGSSATPVGGRRRAGGATPLALRRRPGAALAVATSVARRVARCAAAITVDATFVAHLLLGCPLRADVAAGVGPAARRRVPRRGALLRLDSPLVTTASRRLARPSCRTRRRGRAHRFPLMGSLRRSRP